MNNFYKFIIISNSIAAFACSACSLNSAWDPQSVKGARCVDPKQATPEQNCDEGYSCLINSCIPDNTLPEDETCLFDEQCKEGLVCPPGIFSCHKECSKYYQSDSVCTNPKQYCSPLYHSDTKQFKGYGACLEGECEATKDSATTGKTCSDKNQDCVLFKEGVGKCFTKCTYSLASGSYEDSVTTAGKTCHPVGNTPVNQTMVEWTAGDKVEGEYCDPLANPCQEGLVCISGINPSAKPACHKLCECPEGDKCRGCDENVLCNEQPSFHFCSLAPGGNTDPNNTDPNNTDPESTDHDIPENPPIENPENGSEPTPNSNSNI